MNEENKKQQTPPKGLIKKLIAKEEATIEFLDGTSLVGRVVAVRRYEFDFLVEIEEGKNVYTIMKHAVKLYK